MALERKSSSGYELAIEMSNTTIKCMNMNNPIFEILEKILLHFDLRDLIAAQRVCRSWNQIISGSSVLQTKLFFRPDRGMELSGHWELNPLISEIFNTRFEVSMLSGEVDLFKRSDMEQHLRKDCYSREEASWRRMLVFQPPLKSLHAIFVPCTTCIARDGPEQPWLPEKPRNQLVAFPDGMKVSELNSILPSKPEKYAFSFRPDRIMGGNRHMLWLMISCLRVLCVQADPSSYTEFHLHA